MDELLSQFDFNFTDNFSISSYVINIIIAAILLYILSIVYRRYGKSISNRTQLSKVLIIVGLTTFYYYFNCKIIFSTIFRFGRCFVNL